MVETRGRRWPVHTAWAATAIVLVAATWWAASTILQPAAATPAQAPPPVYTVTSGQIGVEAEAQGQVTFSTERTAIAGRSGVVTEIALAPGAAMTAGDRLLTIDLTPVIVAAGQTPVFRDMALEMRGPDIAQLRLFLGFDGGDYFDWPTFEAVRGWQRSLGVAADGIVHRGDLLFLPVLPARGYVDPEIAVGDVVDPGSELVAVVGGGDILVGADPGGRFRAGMTAHVTLPDGSVVSGILIGPTRHSDGVEYFRLETETGQSPCDDACAAQFPVTTPSQVRVRVELVPVAEGLVVPDSALVVQPDGSLAVRTAEGEIHAVTVTTRGEGTSIVEGIAEGTVIELFGETGASP